MKKIFAISAVCLAFAGVPCVQAEDPGKYTIGGLTGGVNNVAVSATNTYAAFEVSEVDNFGLEVTFRGTAAGTSTVQLFGYKSGGSSYETAPSLSQLITLNGTNAVTTFVPVNVAGAANFKLQIGNTNGSVAVTNVQAIRRVVATLKTRR